jgi:hypothetical protein
MSSKPSLHSKLIAIKLLLIAGTSTGCGIATHGGEAISITGSPEGIRAYHEGLNGLITNGKASADAPDTPYYQLRRQQSAMRSFTSFGGNGSNNAPLVGGSSTFSRDGGK